MSAARGVDGYGPLRRLYWRSRLRWLRKVAPTLRGLRPTDVMIAAYPRSGSSWLRFLLCELLLGEASWALVDARLPRVTRHRSAPALLPDGGRLIRTHSPYQPAYRRAIHLVRDPRDVALSYFRFLQRIGQVEIRPDDDAAVSLDRYLTGFIKGRHDPHGTWQSHLLSWIEAERSGRADVLRVRYEDLRTDTPTVLGQIADWLGVEIPAERAQAAADRWTVARMQAAEVDEQADLPEVFPPAHDRSFLLVHEGRSGRWSEILSEDQRVRFASMARGMEAMGYEV